MKLSGRHGHAKYGNPTPTYRSWGGMKDRCLQRAHASFSYYGGRGITVCSRWMKFTNFLKDMGERPSGTTLDRIDTNGNYEPSNCRWATRHQQDNNRRSNVIVEYRGERMTLTEACEKSGLTFNTAWNRLRHYGWSSDKLFIPPIKPTEQTKAICKRGHLGGYKILPCGAKHCLPCAALRARESRHRKKVAAK